MQEGAASSEAITLKISTPDIIMEPPVATASEAAQRPEGIRERNLPHHLDAPEEEDGDQKGGENGAEPTSKAGEEKADPQLDRALELLKSWNVFKTVVAQSQP